MSCKDSRNKYGESLYKTHCQNCHMENGEGLGALIPPLSSSDYIQSHYNKIPCIIKYGISDTIIVNEIVYENPMAGIANLSDIQISNLINFMREKWYPDMPLMTAEKVKSVLSNCR